MIITPDSPSCVKTGKPWKKIASNYASKDKEYLAADTSNAPFKIALPNSPVYGTTVNVIDDKGTWSTNNLTFLRNGLLIEGLTEDFVCDMTTDKMLTFFYNETTWKIIF